MDFIFIGVVIILTILFAALVLKLSTKFELQSNCEKPIPNDLMPASELEKEIFKTRYWLLGARKDSKYTNALIQECLLSLHVSHGVIESIREEVGGGVDVYTNDQITTIKTGDISYEITNILPYDKTYLGCKVLSFYSKNNNGDFVYRFATIE